MPLTLADRLDIQELLARYNHAIDSGDITTWAACFTADGAFTSGGRTSTGTKELEEFAANFHSRMPGSRHWNNNIVIEGEGDSATMRCYLQLLKTGNGEPATLVTTARYEDTLRRVDGAWRFASRTVVRD
ncbi:MAG: nuclear transport factor 2 family protein [Dehalococcoidia bacterium]|nr:MAG: nuclear transport factor 2 family protein [Dehalococcoidia bacterium]